MQHQLYEVWYNSLKRDHAYEEPEFGKVCKNTEFRLDIVTSSIRSKLRISVVYRGNRDPEPNKKAPVIHLSCVVASNDGAKLPNFRFGTCRTFEGKFGKDLANVCGRARTGQGTWILNGGRAVTIVQCSTTRSYGKVWSRQHGNCAFVECGPPIFSATRTEDRPLIYAVHCVSDKWCGTF